MIWSGNRGLFISYSSNVEAIQMVFRHKTLFWKLIVLKFIISMGYLRLIALKFYSVNMYRVVLKKVNVFQINYNKIIIHSLNVFPDFLKTSVAITLYSDVISSDPWKFRHIALIPSVEKIIENSTGEKRFWFNIKNIKN